MCKKNLRQCKDGNDFIAWARSKGGIINQSTHGVKIYGPKSGYALIHNNHVRELATGTRMALIKVLIAIGLGGLSIGIFIINKLAGG
jgi:hypothetical protein